MDRSRINELSEKSALHSQQTSINSRHRIKHSMLRRSNALIIQRTRCSMAINNLRRFIEQYELPKVNVDFEQRSNSRDQLPFLQFFFLFFFLLALSSPFPSATTFQQSARYRSGIVQNGSREVRREKKKKKKS